MGYVPKSQRVKVAKEWLESWLRTPHETRMILRDLTDYLESQIAHEEKAQLLYQDLISYAKSLKQTDMMEQLQSIMQDEIRHAELIKNMSDKLVELKEEAKEAGF